MDHSTTAAPTAYARFAASRSPARPALLFEAVKRELEQPTPPDPEPQSAPIVQPTAMRWEDIDDHAYRRCPENLHWRVLHGVPREDGCACGKPSSSVEKGERAIHETSAIRLLRESPVNSNRAWMVPLMLGILAIALILIGGARVGFRTVSVAYAPVPRSPTPVVVPRPPIVPRRPIPAVEIPRDGAVVAVETVNVRSSPSIAASVVAKWPYGTQVRVVGQNADWFKVTMPDDTEGWVAAGWIVG